MSARAIQSGPKRRTHLRFLLGNLDTHVFAHDETRDTLVSSRWVNVGKYLFVRSIPDEPGK